VGKGEEERSCSHRVHVESTWQENAGITFVLSILNFCISIF
jgi:hypothetical protein